jgi:hypothetical protein
VPGPDHQRHSQHAGGTAGHPRVLRRMGIEYRRTQTTQVLDQGSPGWEMEFGTVLHWIRLDTYGSTSPCQLTVHRYQQAGGEPSLSQFG